MDILPPALIDISISIDTAYEVFDKFLLAPELETGADSLRDIYQNFLVGAVGVVIFLDQKKDIVNVDFDLADKLGLEDEVIIDILLFSGFAATPLVPEIQIGAGRKPCV